MSWLKIFMMDQTLEVQSSRDSHSLVLLFQVEFAWLMLTKTDTLMPLLFSNSSLQQEEIVTLVLKFG